MTTLFDWLFSCLLWAAQIVPNGKERMWSYRAEIIMRNEAWHFYQMPFDFLMWNKQFAGTTVDVARRCEQSANEEREWRRSCVKG